MNACARVSFLAVTMFAVLGVPTARAADDQVVEDLIREMAWYDAYLARIGPTAADALRPWLGPMRRLTWLRTTLFMARWRVETRAPRDPRNTTQWSGSGLDPKMRDHIDARIDQAFGRGAIRAIRSGWLS